MNVVIAIDSLKGSLSSIEAGEAIKQGILHVDTSAKVYVLPLADGGEGTTLALSEGMGGHLQTVEVCGPFGDIVKAQYGINQTTAIIEMSAAAGITLVPRDQLNPLKATTYGVGEMIKDAIAQGCRRFIIGLGGSATNDCGLGMLQALGFEFRDRIGNLIPEKAGASALADISHISSENIIRELNECHFNIACDVTNPLCGPNGCSAIYGPQKGATPEMIEKMDNWMTGFAKVTSDWAKIHSKCTPDSNFPGCGAAGGLGFAFKTFLNGQLRPGIDLVIEETKMESYIKKADLVFTGEGRLDGQTAMGKAPIGVAKLAKKHGKPVIAIAGCVTPDATKCNEHGIDAFFPILRGITTLDEAMSIETATFNMASTAEQVFRLWVRATKQAHTLE